MGDIVRKRGRTFVAVVAFLAGVWPGAVTTALADGGREAVERPPFEVVREAVRSALDLRFEQAGEALAAAKAEGEKPLKRN